MRLRTLLIATGFTWLAAGSVATAHAATQVAPDTYLIPGAFPKDQQPDGNSIVLLAPSGLVVIDTGRHLEHTQQIFDFAKSVNRPVAAIVNTHWHLDHIGGNVLVREQYPDVQVYASGALKDALRGFLKDYRQQLEDAVATAKAGQDVSAWRAEMRLIDSGAALAPNHTVDKSSTLTIAGRKLAVHLEPNAVTSGDVWLEDPATRILIAGDLVTLPVPFFDTACPKQWEQTLQRMASVQFKTLIPGHGKPMTTQEFATYRHAFSELLQCADSKQPAAACAEQWAVNASSLIEPDDRARIAPMIDYYMQESLRAPASVHPKYCTA